MKRANCFGMARPPTLSPHKGGGMLLAAREACQIKMLLAPLIMTMARRFDRNPALEYTSAGALIDQLFAICQTAASIAIDTGWACSAAITRPFLSTDVDRSAFFIALVVVDVLAGLADSFRPQRRAVSRRSGGPRPASAERRPDGESARRNCLRHRLWRVDRPEDERQAPAPGSRRVVSRLRDARLHEGFRCPARHRGHPDGDRCGRLSQSIALVKRHFDHANLYTANRAIGVLRASGRSRGPSVPQSERWSSGCSDFAARFSRAPLLAWSH